MQHNKVRGCCLWHTFIQVMGNGCIHCTVGSKYVEYVTFLWQCLYFKLCCRCKTLNAVPLFPLLLLLHTHTHTHTHTHMHTHAHTHSPVRCSQDLQLHLLKLPPNTTRSEGTACGERGSEGGREGRGRGRSRRGKRARGRWRENTF